MSLHQAEITSRLRAYLKRRTVPSALKSGDSAIEDQLRAFVRIVTRYAPADPAALDRFWVEFESDLGQRNATWSWPSEGEVGAAAKSAAPAVRIVGGQQGDGIDPVAINLGRLLRGEPISEDWLWGQNALRLVAAGADPAVMRRRRVALADAFGDLYGEDWTRAKLADLRAKHAAAEAALRDWQDGHTVFRDVSIPSKKFDFGDLIV